MLQNFKPFEGVDIVRGIVSMTFTAGMVYGFWTDRVSSDVFVSLASMAIGFYFNSSKVTGKNGNGTGA